MTRAPAIGLLVVAYPSLAAARRAARSLVREGTLACATVVGGATAFYRWEGRFFEERSALLLGKCPWRGIRRVTARVKVSHPDRVPEILALRVGHAWPSYATWVVDVWDQGAKPRRRRPARKVGS